MNKITDTLTDDQIEAFKIIAVGDYTDNDSMLHLYLENVLRLGVEKIVSDRKANIADALLAASPDKQAQVAQILALDPQTFEAVADQGEEIVP